MILAPALASANSVVAWGTNETGQLGDGTTLGSNVPVPVAGLKDVTSVDAGFEHSLALMSDGTVMAWGDNSAGELGDGTTTDTDTPVPVSGLKGVTAISASLGQHSLALLGGGTVMAWGRNNDGQLGDGATTNSDVPVPVSGLGGVVAISAGAEHSLALLNDGTVMAWGNNFAGQLGDGTTTNSDVPVPVSGLSDVVAISAGGLHNLALLSDGTVMSWGSNGHGQLGSGGGSSTVPVHVSELSGVTAIGAGASDSMALLKNGSIMTWGDNFYGDLGRSADSDDLPRPVSGVSGATAIAAGAYQDMASLSDGAVVAWGEGPLGDGTPYESSQPVTVLDESWPTGLSGGATFNLAYGPPAPTVSDVTPHSGAEGTTVDLTGSNLTGATAVEFGTTPASSFVVNSSTSITAVAPAGAGSTDVTVTTPEGKSPTTVADGFAYAAGAPEFGRCIKVAKGTGQYKSATCTSPQAGGAYEWTTEIVRRDFTIAIKETGSAPLQLKTVKEGQASSSLVCKSASGGGEYSGTKEVRDVTVVMAGCKRSDGATCSSEGAAAGEIITNGLEGVLGLDSTTVKGTKEVRKVGLDLFPAGHTGLLFGLTCIGTFAGARGSVIGAMTTDKMSLTSSAVYSESKARQKPEHFEGLPADILEGTLRSGFVVQMGLKSFMTLTSEEPVETNAFV
jgi:alpha-tubulin suppressor-like RCC1 family protein